MTESRYQIVVTAPAARAIREMLPEAATFAVIDFITGPLLDNPRRVGAALRNELEGVWSARRGTYRILYRIDDDRREVIVLRVGHRRDIPRSLRDMLNTHLIEHVFPDSDLAFTATGRMYKSTTLKPQSPVAISAPPSRRRRPCRR